MLDLVLEPSKTLRRLRAPHDVIGGHGDFSGDDGEVVFADDGLARKVGIVQVLIGNVELQRQQQPAIRSRALEYMTVHAIDFLYDHGFIGDHHDQAASQNGLHDS